MLPFRDMPPQTTRGAQGARSQLTIVVFYGKCQLSEHRAHYKTLGHHRLVIGLFGQKHSHQWPCRRSFCRALAVLIMFCLAQKEKILILLSISKESAKRDEEGDYRMLLLVL